MLRWAWGGPLKTTLNANARFNGTAALELIRARFGVVDAGDRSSALKRVQRSYISPGSAVSVKDISKQYDRMTEAHSEYVAAGGNELDDELLQTSLLSALPASYLQIKTALRTQVHGSFDDLYTELLKQVKQYEDDVTEHQNTNAFFGVDQMPSADQLPAMMQAFFGRGRGRGFFGRGAGRGRGDGRGRGAIQTFVTCLRCGILGHSRNICTALVARCAYCAADHLSALCPRGPGGTQRDALSQGARTLLEQDVARQGAPQGKTAQQEQNADQGQSGMVANPPNAQLPAQPNAQLPTQPNSFGMVANPSNRPSGPLSRTLSCQLSPILLPTWTTRRFFRLLPPVSLNLGVPRLNITFWR